MKNNKGFTLVEMLVAVAVLLLVMAEVGSLMVNSQSLYKNGFYEVNLQESAQQVVQQLEDLLMNAVVKDGITIETKTGTVSSDVITIVTKERSLTDEGYYKGSSEMVNVTYKIGRRSDVLGDTSSLREGVDNLPYDDLILTKSSNGKSSGAVLIAEDVSSIKIVRNSAYGSYESEKMYNLNTADVVSLQVNMANKQYQYTATSEVFLRNRPGTGGPDLPPAGKGSGADVDLTVLRVHSTYNLKDYLPKGYDVFEWDPSSSTGADTYYTLGADGSIACNAAVNNAWDLEIGPYTILAEKESSGTAPLKISVHTPTVNDGIRIPVYTWTGTTGTMINAIPVTGICTCEECTKDVVMDAQISLDFADKTHKIAKGENNYPNFDEDLALYHAGKSGFDIKLHVSEKDEDGDIHLAGESVPGDESEVKWNNEVFSRSRSGKLELTQASFSVASWKHRDGFDTEWRGYNLAAGKSNLEKNYMKGFDGGSDGENRCIYPTGTNGGNWFADFTLSSITVPNKANGFGLDTTRHADKGAAYWDTIADNDGCIRIHIWCYFDGVTHDYDHVLDCYGYYFPQKSGNTTQHENYLKKWLMVPIDDEDANPHKHVSAAEVGINGDKFDPYEYYDALD